MSIEQIVAFFRRRNSAYMLTFSKNNPAAQMVLCDLEDFCCSMKTTLRSSDPLELARNEGRRQVWLRIIRAINLTPEQQIALASQTKDSPQ